MSYNPVQDHTEILSEINDMERDCYFPLADFITEVTNGGLTDDDGFGYLCIGNMKTNETIEPSEIKYKNLSKYDGVIWYNYL